MAWGTSTVGPTIKADLGPLVEYLAYRKSPKYQANKDMDVWAKTGAITPYLERFLIAQNPELLSRMKSGLYTQEQIIREFFPQKVQKPPVMTEGELTQALLPQRTEPERLTPPVPTQPAFAPEFRMPTYTPKTISPGWEEDYTSKMIDILTKPREELVTPDLQTQLGVLMKAEQSGYGDIAKLLAPYLPTNYTAGGRIIEFNPITREAKEIYTPPVKKKPVMTAEEALKRGEIEEGTEIIKTEAGTKPKYKVEQRGEGWYVVDVNATTPEAALGSEITVPRGEDNDYQYFDTADGKLVGVNKKNPADVKVVQGVKMPTEKPKETMPPELTRDLNEAEQAISRGLVDKETAARRLIAKWGKEYYSMIKSFVYPEKSLFGD